LVTIQEYQF